MITLHDDFLVKNIRLVSYRDSNGKSSINDSKQNIMDDFRLPWPVSRVFFQSRQVYRIR